MAVRASGSITLAAVTDVSAVTPYYKAQTSTLSPPSKPSAVPPSGWSPTQPTVDTSKTCYIVWLNEYSDGTWDYSDVSTFSEYEAAKAAQITAESAKAIANATSQYFWFDSEGAHVTQIPKDTFIEDVDNGGLNILITSTGSFIRNGAAVLAQYTSDLTVIGDGSSARMELSADGMRMYNEASERTIAIEGSSEQGQGIIVERLNASHINSVSAEISKTPATGTAIVLVGCWGTQSNLVTANFTAGTAGTVNKTVGSRTVKVTYDGAKAFTLQAASVMCVIQSVQYTAIRPAPTITFGTRSGGYGGYSATFGEGLIAETANQFAVGQYNENISDDIFEVGGGSSDTNRATLFAVEANGAFRSAGGGSVSNTLIVGSLQSNGVINGTNVQRNGKNYIAYQTFSFTVAYSAGTIGTRGYQGSANAALDGYTPIGVSVTAVGSSSAYSPNAFLSGNTVYFNAYRASTAAVSNSACAVRVVYRKD